jgi:selenocysteine-specific elongation factor
MVVVTKIDLVDSEMLEIVMEEIKDFSNKTGYADVPVVPISNVTREGLPQVRKVLDKLVSQMSKKHDERAFRMNVERIFSVKGYGTVVTGIPLSGEIAVGDKVQLLPAAKSGRVRAIQNYKYETERTGANICAAINLADISPDEIHRGMTLTSPSGHYRSSKFILAEIRNDSEKYSIRQNMELRFHCGTANISAKVSFLSGKSLAPGKSDFAKIRLTDEVAVASGDRFILRRVSPSVTLGGGTILNNIPQKIKKSGHCFLEALVALENGDYFLAELLSGPYALCRYSELLDLTNMNDGSSEIEDKLAEETLIDLADGAYLIKPKLDIAAEALKKHLSRYHSVNPISLGIDAAEFANLYKIKPGNFAEFASVLAKFDKDIIYSNQRLSLTSFKPSISKEEILRLNLIVQMLTKAGVNAPAIGDIATQLDSNKKETNKLIRLLAEQGEVVSIGKNIILKKIFDDCREHVLDFFKTNEFLQIKDFREITGASRNFSVAILEKFDAVGITKRTEDGRKLMRFHS